jgi:hypothetical protein
MVNTHSKRLEKFSNVPLLVLKTERSPVNIVVTNHKDSDVTKILQVDHVSTVSSCKSCYVTVKDFFTVIRSPALNKLIAVMPTEKTLLFVKQQNYVVDETVNDVFKNNKPIGYMKDDHRYLITYLAASMGNSKPNLVKLDVVDFTKVYAIFFFEELEHRPVKLKDDIIPFVLDLGSFDVNILKMYLPYCQIKNKDFKNYVHKFMDRYSIKSCITVQNVLVGDALFDEDVHSRIIKKIHEKLNDGASMNYYAQFTSNVQYLENFTGHAGHAAGHAGHAAGHAVHSEHFSQDVSVSVDNIQIAFNLDGFYNSRDKTLTIYTNHVDGLPLKVGDRIVLKNQVRDEENGTYDVMKVNDRYSLLRMIPEIYIPKMSPKESASVYVSPQHVDGTYDVLNKTLTIPSDKINNVALILMQKVILKKQQRPEQNGLYEVVTLGTKKSVLRLIPPPPPPSYEDKYVCVGDPSKNTKASCEANPKNVWDRPCVTNTECPFYQSNVYYRNYRGGCIDGTCEMPVGVKVRGFRYAENKDDALCHGCPIDNLKCCKTQRLPNYAFTMDRHERMSDNAAYSPLAKSLSSSLSPSSFSPR